MRPDILIHWTGKDICLDPSSLAPSTRAEYVERLRSILDEGFWMTSPREKISGFNNSWIEYEAHVTCFSEVRLTAAQRHARCYGLLGIGVTRRFVLDRFGGPVHYVRNSPTECVIGNAQEILNALRASNNADLVEYFSVNCAFLKNMSTFDTDDFALLDEQEWRIAQTHRQLQIGNIRATGLLSPQFRIPVRRGDVRVLIFPDETTRELSMQDRRLSKLLRIDGYPDPVQFTLADCDHF